MTRLLYANLTYAIRGVLMQVHFHNHHLGSVSCRLIVVDDKIAIAAFALCGVGEAERMALHARLRQLDLQLGLLANFHHSLDRLDGFSDFRNNIYFIFYQEVQRFNRAAVEG